MRVQKKLLLGPVFNTLDPKLPGNRTRRPAQVFLHVSPQIFLVFTFRPSVFAENPRNLVLLAVKPLELVLGLDFAF